MKRVLSTIALGLGITAAALPFMAQPAQAWWAPYGYAYGWRAPVVVVAPPPVVYVRPRPVWVAPYWYSGRYHRGYWR